MQQMIKEPIRRQYLLDLYLSDIAGIKVKVGPQIADHKMIIAKIPLPDIQSLEITRERFNLKKGRWKDLNDTLLSVDWSVLRHGTADDAAKKFLEILWTYLCNFIPYEKIEFRKRSHPWINERCEQAIKRKNAAEGIHQFQDMQKNVQAFCRTSTNNIY